MAYYDLNERAVLAMMTRLRNNLNANIDAINAATTADPTRPQFQIPHPQQILDAPPVAGQLNAGFPIVAMADGNIGWEDDVGWSATGVYEMMVLAYVTSQDPAELAWMLRRYAQAITTTAIVGRNVNEGSYLGAWGSVVKRILPGRRLSRVDPSGAVELMAWVAVVIEAKDDQTAP